jgi:hypothetical protein
MKCLRVCTLWHTTAIDLAGAYSLVDIPPGKYSARALKEGLATTEVIGIQRAPEILDTN